MQYHRLWREAGFEPRLIEVAGKNHFDVVLDLASETSALTRALLALMGKSG